ncbi:hypothetical protein [Streptomyces europaeiscabiei]|uniref:hypothetical protein n=1 Tax=Streptomyces europaeiscabiei TaxID=146819 RepID=UPI0029B93D0C|nr:hypothetical protein [Streptomyces europaeiscabiei]MDX3615095.1 hypothetical protein [Streptomyces europaeiscabiei]
MRRSAGRRLSTKGTYEIATRHESKSKGVDKTTDLRATAPSAAGIGRKNDGKTSAGTRSEKACINAQKDGSLWIIKRQPRQEQQVTSVLSQRVAPVLLLLQVACIGLFAVLITTLPPDTAELDHTDTSALDTALHAATLLAIVVALLGAATLLALEKIRAGTPRAVRAGWLGVVALGQGAIAARALINILGQDPGPDIVFGVVMAVTALGIAAACINEARGSAPIRPHVQAWTASPVRGVPKLPVGAPRGLYGPYPGFRNRQVRDHVPGTVHEPRHGRNGDGTTDV